MPAPDRGGVAVLIATIAIGVVAVLIATITTGAAIMIGVIDTDEDAVRWAVGRHDQIELDATGASELLQLEYF